MTDATSATVSDDEPILIPATLDELDAGDERARTTSVSDADYGSTASGGRDLTEMREWARERAEAARQRVVEEPLRSAFTALGVGVIIGMLLRR